LAEEINTFCKSKELPLEIVFFGSLFRFKFKGNLDLLFYFLLKNNIYVWEGRNCFISYVHSDRDLYCLQQAILQSIDELIQIKFFG
jgi:glutamate-1-semialdehyde aminotransferase